MHNEHPRRLPGWVPVLAFSLISALAGWAYGQGSQQQATADLVRRVTVIEENYVQEREMRQVLDQLSQMHQELDSINQTLIQGAQRNP